MTEHSDLLTDALERIEELEERVAQQEARIDELEEQLEQEREQRETVDGHQAKELNKVQAALKEKADRENVDEKFTRAMNRYYDLKNAECYDTIAGVPEPELSWMERFVHLGRDSVDGRILKPDLYAKILFENLPDWAWRDNGGNIILPTASRLKAKIARHSDEFAYHEQLYRACEALADRTDGKIQYRHRTDDPSVKKIGNHLRIDAEDVDDVALDFTGVSGPPMSETGKRTLLACA